MWEGGSSYIPYQSMEQTRATSVLLVIRDVMELCVKKQIHRYLYLNRAGDVQEAMTDIDAATQVGADDGRCSWWLLESSSFQVLCLPVSKAHLPIRGSFPRAA